MNPEQLLNALTDIHSDFISDARTESPVRKSIRRRFAVLTAAVITVTALAVTALAAEEIGGWFRQYFAKQSDAPLTPGQVEFIEENEQIFNNIQTHNGYTIELKSAIGYGKTTYITLGITAPENIVMLDWDSLYFNGSAVTDDQGQFPELVSMIPQNDFDGLDNTAEIVLIVEQYAPDAPSFWKIQIDTLYGENYDREYELELIRTKYANQPDITGFTSEEMARIYQRTLLTAGSWEFIVEIPDSNIESIEFITEPIALTAIIDTSKAGEIASVTMTSFLLRPLDASICYELPFDEGEPLGYSTKFIDIFAKVVMKDGSHIPLRKSWGGATGEQKLLADAPIILEEVDYILLADGTKLMVP